MSTGLDGVETARDLDLALKTAVRVTDEKTSAKLPEEGYDVFISYSRAADETASQRVSGFSAWLPRCIVHIFRTTVDETIAQSVSSFLSRFHRRILREPLPKEVKDKVRQLRVWLDRASFHQPVGVGNETGRKGLDESLLKHVDNSRCVLLLASKGAADSRSVNLEVSHFLGKPPLSAKKELRIAVIEGADPHRELESYLPPGLHGRKLEEALGYDLRGLSKKRTESWKNVDDPTDALVRLAGDLLEVSGERLLPAWRRQEKKEQRRALTAITVVASVIVALVLAFSNERVMNAELSVKNTELSTQKKLVEQKEALTAHEKVVEEEKARLNGAVSQLETDPSEALAIARQAALPETRLDRWTIRTQARLSGAIEAKAQASGKIGTLAVSGDGRWLASGANLPGVGGSLQIWSLPLSRSPVFTTSTAGGDVLQLAFTADGKLISYYGDGTVTRWAWDGRVLKPEGSFELKASGLVSAISTNADRLAVGIGPDVMVTALGQAATLAPGHIIKLTPPIRDRKDISTLAFAVDERMLFAATTDGSLHAFDLNTGHHLARAKPSGSSVTVTALAAGRDGDVAVGKENGQLQLWRFAGGKLSFVFDFCARPTQGGYNRDCPHGAPHTGKVRTLTFTRDGSRLVSGAASSLLAVAPDHSGRVWDAQTGDPLSPPLEGHTKFVMSSVILPGAHSFISGDGEGELRQWPLETWHYPLTRPIPDMDPTIDNDVQLAFAEGSTLLAAGCPDACWLVRLSLPELTVLERNEFIRRGTRARISTPPSETKEHIELTVRTDDEAFDVVISKHLEVLSKTPTAAATVARSPNGKYRLVASGEALSLQDTQNQRSVSLAFEREGLSTAWSADGRWLALASRSGKSLLLDVTTQQTRPVRTVEQTNSIAWSPSADWFVTAGDDGFLSYWREESGQFAPKRAASRHGGTFPSIVLMDLFGGVIGPGRNVADLAAFDDRVARKPSEPSRTYAVSAGYDFALRFWSDQGGPIGTPVTPTRHWQKHVLAAPEQRWLAFSDAAGHVGVVDLQNLDVQ